MVVLRLPARHGGLRKSLENESDFIEIHAVFCKSLEINKTNSVLRTLYGVMSLCSLCNFGFCLLFLILFSSTSKSPLFSSPGLRYDSPVVLGIFRSPGLGTDYLQTLKT